MVSVDPDWNFEEVNDNRGNNLINAFGGAVRKSVGSNGLIVVFSGLKCLESDWVEAFEIQYTTKIDCSSVILKTERWFLGN